MSLDDVAGILGAVAVVLTAVTGLLGYRWGRGNTRAEETLTRATARKVQAEAEAAEANSSIETIAGNIDRRFDELTTRIDRVVHEVTPNHGGSMKDALRRVEESQARLSQDQAHDREEQAEWRKSLGHQVGEIRQTVTSEAEDRRDGDKRVAQATTRIQETVDHIMEDHGDRLGYLESELRRNHPC